MANKGTETPTLTKVIRDGLDQAFANVNTAMPGKILDYDKAKGTCTVQPQLKRKYKSEASAISLKPIANVPVIFPGTATAFFRFHLKAGDTVQLLFNQRSIDRWITRGVEVDPEFAGRFQLTDAVAIPGLLPKTDPRTDAGAAFIDIDEDGKFKITGKSGEDLLDLLDQTLSALQTQQVVIATGSSAGTHPVVTVPPGTFTTIQNLLAGIKS